MPTQEDTRLRHRLKATLQGYPHLAALVPGSLFGGNAITTDRLRRYSDSRAERFWHNINLPLVLHASEASQDARARALMRSILVTFEDFAARFQNAEGIRSTLKPLWTDIWAKDPAFWSVATCAYLALAWDIRNFKVERFEEKTGLGNADADLTVQLGTTKALVDIEMEHLPTLAGLSTESVKARLRRRADQKAGTKFPSAMQENTQGVIAEVCVVAGEDVAWRPDPPTLSAEALPDRNGAAWMALRLVGVAHTDGLRFAIMPL